MISIKTTITETRPPEVSARAWTQITRQAHADQALAWVKHDLPNHFKLHARFAYRHRPRRPATKARKTRDAQRGRAEEGGLVDMVHSGDLRKAVLSAPSIRAFPSRARITLNGPSYLRMKPRTTTLPDMAAEVFTVTTPEARDLDRVLEHRVTRELNNVRQPKTTTNT
jgi:hypothetical protein